MPNNWTGMLSSSPLQWGLRCRADRHIMADASFHPGPGLETSLLMKDGDNTYLRPTYS